MALNDTVPTNTSPVATWPAILRSIATFVNGLAAEIGGDYARQVRSQNISATLTDADLNWVITVDSTSAVTLTLPEVTSAHKGRWIRIHKLSIGNLTVTAGGFDTIAQGGALNSLADEPKAAFVELEVVAAGQWMISGMLGTWN